LVVEKCMELVIVFGTVEAERRPYDVRDAFLKCFDQQMAADK
jgi:hypothetical protein